MVLGDKIENAYSVENMQKAHESLKEQNTLKNLKKDEFEIETTHLYVRFLPKDSLELNLLSNDTVLELFDYPLDYEIKEEGMAYHDPEIPEGELTWQYTVVPLGYEFPNIKYEVIEECFIPDEDSEETKKKSTGYSELLALVEYESMKLTDNLTEEEKEESKLKGWFSGWLPSKKHPQGTIRVNNSVLGLEGVEKVKIRTHRIVKISNCYTDANGNYRIPKSYRWAPHYAIIFENHNGFKIWGNNLYFAPAKYNMGWHQKEGHSIDIHSNSQAWKWCTVNNAVCRYLSYCSQFGITRPPSDLRLWVKGTNKNGVIGSAAMLRRTWGWYGFNTHSKLNNYFNNVCGLNLSITAVASLVKFIAPDITISVNSNAVTDDVYNTVFHECAHASHYQKVGRSYWVNYINYIITYGAYGNGTGKNAGYCGVGEMWGNYVGALYEREAFINSWPYRGTTFANSWTNWFDEAEDWYNPGFLRRVDNIGDVTTSEIFSCLTRSTNTIEKLVESLKTKTINDVDVDNAYASYNDWP